MFHCLFHHWSSWTHGCWYYLFSFLNTLSLVALMPCSVLQTRTSHIFSHIFYRNLRSKMQTNTNMIMPTGWLWKQVSGSRRAFAWPLKPLVDIKNHSYFTKCVCPKERARPRGILFLYSQHIALGTVYMYFLFVLSQTKCLNSPALCCSLSVLHCSSKDVCLSLKHAGGS